MLLLEFISTNVRQLSYAVRSVKEYQSNATIIIYTTKNYELLEVVENRMQHCSLGNIVLGLPTILNNIVDPESSRNQV